MTARIEQINRLAFDLADMPDDLSSAEQYLFLALRAMYRDYKVTHDKVKGEREKALIMKQYERLERLHETYMQTANMRSRLSVLLSEAYKGDCPMCKEIVRLFDNLKARIEK